MGEEVDPLLLLIWPALLALSRTLWRTYRRLLDEETLGWLRRSARGVGRGMRDVANTPGCNRQPGSRPLIVPSVNWSGKGSFGHPPRRRREDLLAGAGGAGGGVMCAASLRRVSRSRSRWKVV
eukprot:3774516-Prymnesium_polylepis.1